MLKEFVEKIELLEKEYGFRITSTCEEEVDRGYDGEYYISNCDSVVLLVNEKEEEFSLDMLRSSDQ